MDFNELKSLDRKYVSHSYGRFDVDIDRGCGASLYSLDGKKYVDFSSGIGVVSIGHANPKWVEAITSQAAKLGHVSNLYYTSPGAILAEKLVNLSSMENVFFANSGAEANEGMIKLCRKYSFDKYGKGRHVIVTLKNSFHGRTVTTLSATGQDHFHNYFYPFTEGFTFVDAGDIQALENMGGDVCAVMLELIQGEGGVVPLDYQYVRDVARLCEERGWLLAIDEIQTGVGRTGTFFAFSQYGIKPDVVTIAKGIAGGLPLSCVIAGEKCAGVFTPGTHATTFGANPVACAAAKAVLDTLDEHTLSEVRAKGEYIKKKIESFKSPFLGEVRGLGLMLGAPVRGVSHRDLVVKLIEAGLLALTAGSDTLRLLPPLTITYGEIDEGLAILENTLKQL